MCFPRRWHCRQQPKNTQGLAVNTAPLTLGVTSGGAFKNPQILPTMDSAGDTHKIVQLAVGDLNSDNRQDIVAAMRAPPNRNCRRRDLPRG